MNVNFNAGHSGFANVHRINQSIAAKNGNNTHAKSSRVGRRDSVTISPLGRKSNPLENLMNQKTRITDQKNSLIASTLEKGGSLDSIKSQLENFDEQMKSVNDQIAEVMAKEMEKQTDRMKKQEDSEPKTKEEIQNEQLADITDLSADIKQAQTISSVQARVDGNAKVLKSEIKLDKQYSGSSPGSNDMISKKEATLEAMEQKSLSLTSELSQKLSATADKASEVDTLQNTLSSLEVEDKADKAQASEASPFVPDKTDAEEKAQLQDQVK